MIPAANLLHNFKKGIGAEGKTAAGIKAPAAGKAGFSGT
jgi:hypothetical protein